MILDMLGTGQLVVFTIVTSTLSANVFVIDEASSNGTAVQFESVPPEAGFGPTFTKEVQGYLAKADPIMACTIIQPPPKNFSKHSSWISLIERGHCDFAQKILNAQSAGFDAALIYNDNVNATLTQMTGDQGNIRIPSWNIRKRDGLELAEKHLYPTKHRILIFTERDFIKKLHG